MLENIGAAAGPLIAFLVLLAIPNGFSTVFVVSLAFSAIGVAVLVLIVPGRKRGQPEPDVRNRTSIRWPRLRFPRIRWVHLKEQGLGRPMLTAGLLGTLTVGDGFIYPDLQDRGSFAVQWFLLLYVGTNAAFLLFAVPLGRLADRWGRIPVFLSGHVALLACYLLAALPFAGLGVTLGCLVLLGLFYAATDGVLAALVSQLSAPEKLGTALGSAQTVVALSRMAAASGFGVLWFAVGPGTAMACMAILLAVALGAAAVLMRGPARQMVAP